MENNSYSEALREAPEWVIKAYEEFKQQSPQQQDKRPFLYFLLGSGKGTQPFKMPKSTAKYVHISATGQRCDNCIFFFIQPKGARKICSKVRGQVNSGGWCKLWE